MTLVGNLALRDVEEAVKRLKGIAHRTPVMTSRTLNEMVGAKVYFKCENFQRIGAFKFRGAYNCIAKLLEKKPELREYGVVAVSSGNHAQGVALAAKLLGMPAKIYIPKDAPQSKIEATRGYGASLEFFDRNVDDRDAIVADLKQNSKAALIHGYDNLDIIAGQGTAAYELLEDVRDMDVIMAPLGGGGLLAGTLIAAKNLKPEIKGYGIEPERANDWYQSLKQGSRVKIEAPKTIADGLSICSPGEITFPIVKQLIDDVFLVTETEIIEAMKFVFFRMKLVIEPSAAVPVAALMFHKLKVEPGQKIGLILSGGNTDPAFLKTIF